MGVCEAHRLAGPIPPNWRVGGEKRGLYRLEIGSKIDLVTWKYDLVASMTDLGFDL